MARTASNDSRIPRSVKFTPEIDAELERVADERDTSISHLVNKAVGWYLKHLPPLPGDPEIAAHAVEAAKAKAVKA